MRVAVIGSRGQLGTDLCRRLGVDAVPLTHDDVEVADSASVGAAIDAAQPEIVINTAAYNLVDRAEDEPDVAWRVNALGSRNLALATAARGIPLLHVSTDFVFGQETSRTTAYDEDDTPGPLSAYATSKLAGEHFVRSINPRHFVVRTCGLYGTAGRTGNGNFVETMLRLAAERDRLTVVNDQRCTPTATSDLAALIVPLLETDAWGLYHATNSGSATWFEFAMEIMRLAGQDVEIAPISSAEFGAKAQRPAYSVLDGRKLTAITGVEPDDWKTALSRYMANRK